MQAIRPIALALVLALILTAAGPSPDAFPAPGKQQYDVEELAANIRDAAQTASRQDERERDARRLGRIGTPAAVEVLVDLLGDPFHHIRERAMLVLLGIGPNDPGISETDAFEALVRCGSQHENALARQNVAVTLGRFGPRPGVQDQWELITEWLSREREDAVKVELCRALGRIGVDNEDIVRTLERAGRRGPAQAAATLALARLGHIPFETDRIDREIRGREWVYDVAVIDAAIETGLGIPQAVQAALDTRCSQTKIAGLQAAVAWHADAPEAAIEAVAAVLADDDDWRVRAAAIQSLFGMWDKAAIDPLIAQFAEEEGRLKLDIFNILRFYTAQNYGLNVQMWRTWWNANASRFELGERPEATEWGVDMADPPEGDDDTAAFFDIPILSQRLLFCIDPSRSMGNQAVREDGSPRKIDYAADHIRQAVEALPEDAQFNVWLYRYWSGFPPRQELEQAFPQLSEANRRAGMAMREFIGGLEPEGWGDFYGALTTCFAHEEVDTVYFLSDGGATRGEHVISEELVRALKEANRFRQVTVHTVLVGEVGADAELMRNMAIATGGMFKQVDLETDDD